MKIKVFLPFAFFFASFISAPRSALANDAINISAILSLSGFAASDGQTVQRAMDMAVEDLKAEGIDVNIHYHDDQTETRHAVTAAQFVLSSEKPDAVIGPLWSFLGRATFPILDKAGMLTISPVSTSEVTTYSGSCIHYTAPKFIQQSKAVSYWLRQRKAKTAAILTTTDPWGDIFLAAVRAGLAEANVKEIHLESTHYVGYEQAFERFIQNVQKNKPDVAFVTNVEAGDHYLVKRWRERKVETPIVGTTDLVSVFQFSGEKIIAGDDFSGIVTDVPAEFRSRFEQRYGTPPRTFGDRAYDSIKMLVHTIRNAPAAERCSFLRHLTFRGMSSTYTFDDHGDTRLQEWHVRQITND